MQCRLTACGHHHIIRQALPAIGKRKSTDSLFGACSRTAGIPGASGTSTGLACLGYLPLRACSLVLLGIQSHDVRGSGTTGNRLNVERMAASSACAELL